MKGTRDVDVAFKQEVVEDMPGNLQKALHKREEAGTPMETTLEVVRGRSGIPRMRQGPTRKMRAGLID